MSKSPCAWIFVSKSLALGWLCGTVLACAGPATPATPAAPATPAPVRHTAGPAPARLPDARRPDPPESGLSLHGACADGDVQDCVRNAESLRDATETQPRAAAHYEKACELGHLESCISLGIMLANGIGVARQAARAQMLFSRACSAGIVAGCIRAELRGATTARPGAQVAACASGSLAACESLAGLSNDELPVSEDQETDIQVVGACTHGEKAKCVPAAMLRLRGGDSSQLPLLKQQCEGGRVEVCSFLGKGFDAGMGVPADSALALQYYEKACRGGFAEGCARQGASVLQGNAGPRDPAKAAKLFEIACRKDSMFGCAGTVVSAFERGDQAAVTKASQALCLRKMHYFCAFVGVGYEKGFGIAPDREKAKALYASACSNEIDFGCYRLGLLLSDEPSTDVPSPACKAERRACDLGSNKGCLVLGVLSASGWHCPKDEQAAARLFNKACRASPDDSEACSYEGRFLMYGIGTAKDLPRAKELLTQACSRGDGHGCYYLGRLHRDSGQKEAARAAYEAACKNNRWDACEELGVMIRGEGSDESLDSAAAPWLRIACESGKRGSACTQYALARKESTSLFMKGCELEDMAGCWAAGVGYLRGTDVAKDPKKAAALFTRSCNGNFLQACNHLGYLFAEGNGIAADGRKAMELFTRACGGGLAAACDSVGEAFEKGWGTPSEPLKAIAQYKKACSMGASEGCENAKRLARQPEAGR